MSKFKVVNFGSKFRPQQAIMSTEISKFNQIFENLFFIQIKLFSNKHVHGHMDIVPIKIFIFSE